MEVHLKLEGGDEPLTWILTPGEMQLFGSGEGTISLPGLAPKHAAVRIQDETVEIVSLESATLLNEDPLPQRVPTEVQAGDLVSIGGHRLRVSIVGGDRRRRARRRRTAPLTNPGVPTDQYELKGEIGRGAQGRVYAAVRRSDGRPVAIKVLAETVEPGSIAERRFEREGKVGAQLQSPFVVQVFDLLTTGGRLGIVMELVAGPSVRDLLSRHSGEQAPIAHALRVGVDVATALALAAEQGIVHRDVKPANILLAPEGCAKLTDFGLAKNVETTVYALTSSGQGLGTLAYMPPEQVAWAKEADPRADVYSLGATLYHLITGEPPFSVTTTDSLTDILNTPPRPVRGYRPDCPEPVAEFVMNRMLPKAPEDRAAPGLVPQRLRALLDTVCPGATFEGLFGPPA